jgi:hypothetical protein
MKLSVVSVALVLRIIVTPGVILIGVHLAILICVGCSPTMPSIVGVPETAAWIVFDAETGAYKRHWGTYGNKPDDNASKERHG